MPFNRPLYGYTVVCQCGWEKRINGNKRETQPFHNDHLRDVREADDG